MMPRLHWPGYVLLGVGALRAFVPVQRCLPFQSNTFMEHVRVWPWDSPCAGG